MWWGGAALVLVTVLLAQVQAQVQAQTFFITCSKYVRPGVPLDVSVSIGSSVKTPSTITATVVGRTSYRNPEVTVDSAVATFQSPLTSGKLTLNMDNLTPAMYSVKLKLEGTGGVTFNQTKALQVESKTRSIFIQTDKKMYKPGQKVRIRVISVDANLKFDPSPMNIEIIDAKGNKVKSLKNHDTDVSKKFGAHIFEQSISDQPNLGKWRIIAKTEKNSQEATFEIAEYVLPKFEVNVILPSYKIMDQTGLTVYIEAKYTFGQPVKGNVSLLFDLKYQGSSSRYYGVKKGKILRLLMLKNGRAETHFTDTEILSVKFEPEGCYPKTYRDDALKCHMDAYRGDGRYMPATKVVVEANVTETLTGVTLSGEGSAPLETNSIKLDFLAITPNNFKVGQEYMAMLKVTQQDGAPIDSTFLPMSVGVSTTLTFESDDGTVIQAYQSSKTETREIDSFNVDESGIIVIPYNVPAKVKSFSLVANATDPKTMSIKKKNVFARKHDIGQYKSGTNATLQILRSKGNGPLKAGTKESFIIKSTDIITGDYNYVILSKGVIVTTEMVYAATTLKPMQEGDPIYRYEFTVDFTSELAQQTTPSARIVLYYTTDENKLLVDTIDFDVEGGIANEVTCDFSTNQTKPGENVNLLLTSAPNSLVLLSAVDTSTTLVAGGEENAITKDLVLSEQKEFDPSNRNIYPMPYFRGGMMDKRKKRSFYCGPWCWWPITTGGSDTSEVLDRAGLLVFTDSYIHKKKIEHRYYNSARGRAGPAGPSGPGGPPMMAMPESAAGFPGGPTSRKGAPSGGGQGGSVLNKPVTIRKDFPETWLWNNKLIGPDGRVEITEKAPDTITSWVATAWGISPESGLGVADPSTVTVFKPFFVSLTLPYALIMGELFNLKTTVFNYMKVKQEVTITLKNSGDFKAYKDGVQDNAEPVDGDIVKKIMVPANDGVTQNLWIKPTSLGGIPILVIGRGISAQDAVRRTLLVKPPGSTEENTVTMLLNMTGDVDERTTTVNLDIPKEFPFFVPGSENIDIFAIGDIMGKALANLDGLMKMPYGCGEQNMVNFAPNIYVREYLVATSQVTEEYKKKTDTNMQKGLQRELTYHRLDGGVSAFGDRDKAGSVWLSALVIKSYNQAMQYISIDEDVIRNVGTFIVQQQRPDGTYNEPGNVHNTRLVGGSSSNGRAALTAFILIALTQNDKILTEKKYQDSMERAQGYLEKNIPSISNNVYSLAITYYALTMRDSSATSDIKARLMKLAIRDGGDLHFGDPPPPPPKVSSRGWFPRHRRALSTEIETTAYALLGLLNHGDMENSLQIVKWLVRQQNERGGFASTQDTIISLQALSLLATKTHGTLNCVSENLRINVKPKSKSDSTERSFEPINRDNALVLQSIQLPKDTTQVEITTRECGFAMVQVQAEWNVMEAEEDQSIQVSVSSLVDEFKQVIVKACAKWLNAQAENSGMAVMELATLSGYDAKIENLLEKYQASNGLKRVESEISKVVLYLDKITRQELCFEIPLVKVNDVSNLQESTLSVYGYYEPEKIMTKMYLPSALRSIKPCEACPTCCYTKGTAAVHSNNHQPSIHCSTFTMLLSIIFFVVYSNINRILR